VEVPALLDLVCGPVGPLPETRQRYRLVSHLGTGGQAQVYRAARVSGGISSAPVTVKVFRAGKDRPLEEQLRAWDKGDAVLMDLNSRGISGICRRCDGFYAPPPHPPARPPTGDSVPYQVLDYLHGVTLREYIEKRYGVDGGRPGPRLDAVSALLSLANMLWSLHLPYDPNACPVLHMDVKPSNVMVLTGGEVRLIDFTGSRYDRRDHITTVSYTPEAGGPEAFSGEIGPGYDVHGFGAVAYFMVTGDFPRGEASPLDGKPTPPWAVLRRHPLLDAHPKLREHLLAPLADRPGDRPSTPELPEWVRRLAPLVTSASCPDVGVDWSTSRQQPPVVGRATVSPVAGTETGSFQRIEKLERELVELRSAMSGRASVPKQPQQLDKTLIAPPPADAPPGAAARQASNGAAVRGVATVPAAPEQEPTIDAPPAPTSWWTRRSDLRPAPDSAVVLKRGSEITGFGLVFAFVCWGIWSIASGTTGMVDRFLIFVVVLLVGAGIFALSRLLGRLVWERLMGRIRRNARGAHAITAAYLAAAGIGFLGQTPWVVAFWGWLERLV
jgi:serine/threonine protein kinase